MKKFHLLPLTLALFAVITVSAAEPEIRYVDATKLNIIGKAMSTEQSYNRIDTTRFEIPKKPRSYCYHPTGMAVVFRTNSPLIAARWQTSTRNASDNMSAIAQKGLDLYIREGNQWVFAGVGRPKMSSKNNKHEWTIVNNMKPGERECMLYLPLYDCLTALEIGVAENSSISAIENPFRHKVVLHGSSITHGISAGRAGMSYGSLISRHTGLYIPNLGFSGQCMMQPEFANYLSQVEADAFILDCFSNPSAKLIEERFNAFVDKLRSTHPTTPLIFIQTIIRETALYDTKIQKSENEKRAMGEKLIRERMKGDKHLYFVDPGNLLGTDHNNTVDGVHPTDRGFECLVEALEPEIVKILNKYDIN